MLHISYSDKLGGAEQFAYDFVHSSSLDCRLAVYKKNSDSNKVIRLPKTILDYFFDNLDKVLFKLGLKNGLKPLFSLSDTLNFTYNKLKKIKAYEEADIIHLNNIHGGYFDLKSLLKISREKPILWTLHDMWSITGGEAHVFENENYKRGIGLTPYAKNYPLFNPLLDLRQYYLKKKKRIYEQIAHNTIWAPASYWLADCVRESYVFNSEMKLIPIQYGINLDIFKNKNDRTWEIARVLFFNSPSPFKGSDFFENIIPDISHECEIIVVGKKLTIHRDNIIYRDFISDREELATLYNSVDILVFPSIADTFPFTVLEAMTCGVCVIASDVGGITEQLKNEAGILFEINNSSDLLLKLNDCIKNLATARAIGLKSSQQATEKYNRTEMYQKYAKAYQSLLND